MKILHRLAVVAGVIVSVPATYALADFLMTQGAGTTFFDFTCFVTKHCSASAIVNSAGTEIFTTSNPAQVSLANTGTNGSPITVSASSLPLPTGAATVAKQPALGTAGAPAADVITVQGNPSGTAVPISAAALPLPSNAATQTLQTAGNASLATIATNTGAAVPTVQSGSPIALISCNNHTLQNITTAADTMLVIGITSQVIYVCGWRSRAGGVASWFLESTGTTAGTCSGTNTAMTATAVEAVNTGEVMNPAFWSGLKTPASNGLCIHTVAGIVGPLGIDVWYTQF